MSWFMYANSQQHAYSFWYDFECIIQTWNIKFQSLSNIQCNFHIQKWLYVLNLIQNISILNSQLQLKKKKKNIKFGYGCLMQPILSSYSTSPSLHSLSAIGIYKSKRNNQ